LKILQVQNFFRLAGGEAPAIDNERKLLQSRGHEVELYSVTNDWSRGLRSKLEAAIHAAYSEKERQKLRRHISLTGPDIVHVHNFFPLLTPSVFDACLEEGVPAVHTLHSFRPLCPNALFWRGGHVCEDCLRRNPYLAAFHRCYRRSFLGTLAAARVVAVHRRRATWQTRVDAFIALTDFAREKFVAGGFPEGRVFVKPNFVFPDPGTGSSRGGHALYAGRFARGKGIATLLEAWRGLHRDVPLRLAGDGPLRPLVQRAAENIPNVEYLGFLANEEVLAEMKKAAFLVFPSRLYEQFPMVLAEAFAAGLPVVTSRLGAMSAIVKEGVSGLFFEAGNVGSLQSVVRKLTGNGELLNSLSRGAREAYEKNYTSEKNYAILRRIYDTARRKG